MNRRQFILKNGVLIGGITMIPSDLLRLNTVFISKRPPENERKFVSDEVEKLIKNIKSEIADQEIAWMFENCFPNTLDTTVDYEVIDNRPDTFIITGDIDAMWLRDSTAQIWPYLPLIRKDENLKTLIKGLINRHVRCILLDPYANAFYKDKGKVSEWAGDNTSMLPGIHERKWEIDSLCYPVRLAYEYYRLSGDSSIFDNEWDKAARLIVYTFRTEQRKDGNSPYSFSRVTDRMIDSPPFGGKGRPVRPVGLICSMFRPSDDATVFPFVVPSNHFAILSLRQLAVIYSGIMNDNLFAGDCFLLADEVGNAIQEYAVFDHPHFDRIYAYEVDGYGSRLFMDDANIPSLMSLSYLGVHKSEDAVYQNTRRFLLSESNPYFLKGKAAEGQASPHTGKNNIWPMGIILRAMTSIDDEEIKYCLKMLKTTHAGTGFMHESFNKDNPSVYTRDWFAWANTLFGELVIKIHNERKHILSGQF